MSIPVDLDELAAAMATYPTAFLLTVNEDGRVHAVQVHPALRDGGLQVSEQGRRTNANLLVRPDVTVLFPPYEPGGYTLLVDGRVAPAGGDRAGITVTPITAVLHRAATSPGPAALGATAAAPVDACGNDCVPLGGH